MASPTNNVPHGTPNGYNHYACRCPLCRTANTEVHAQLRIRLRARGLVPGDPRHGTRNGYSNYGCNCMACRTAQLTYMAKWRAGRDT